jgi:hypothetical protein
VGGQRRVGAGRAVVVLAGAVAAGVLRVRFPHSLGLPLAGPVAGYGARAVRLGRR